ncbi:ATPase, YjeE family [Rubidibacter lacunae KORDI 51-2]|uniref:tRNA threonylcarbamoyladenosine biosynthesis protein TsaE n=1 Tax=Rubidibacter lacunae KORDI 51-2 TaxID=582515 RepID=U5DLR7_9CHRO|nr:tRNA (adenosine(37)-N6)-threonylcarbamoyltransferase complex ATPase subunit type 1 TsaE [Rubidibacter lacunae]ERN41837.1 ATPase, YjeE family [Rubidibacter lacunae KORDI 51-2]
MHWQTHLEDAAATQRLGYRLGQQLIPGSTLLLHGDLGAGKTTLVQGLGAGLGIDQAIASPTFALANEYLEGRVPLYHLDLYRLEPPAVAGLLPELYWEGEEVLPGIVAIEWAQRLPYLPPSYVNLWLEMVGDSRRATLEFVSADAIAQALRPVLQAISGTFDGPADDRRTRRAQGDSSINR